MKDALVTYRIAEWRKRLETPLFPEREVERLIRRAGDDPVMIRFVRDSIDRRRIGHELDNCKMWNDVGDPSQAIESLDLLDRAYQFVRERILISLAQQGLRGNEQKIRAGKAPKRRAWADILAERVGDWESIPKAPEDLTIDELERAYRFLRDGDKVVALDAESGAEIGELKRSTFEKRYLRRGRHKRR